MQERNPLLEPEDYMLGYKKSIEEMKNRPEIIEFDRLCFEIFELNPQGKKFLELVKERYLIPALAKPGTATYQLDVLWGEGFKEFIRTIISAVITHKQRIKAGTN